MNSLHCFTRSFLLWFCANRVFSIPQENSALTVGGSSDVSQAEDSAACRGERSDDVAVLLQHHSQAISALQAELAAVKAQTGNL